MNKEKMEQIIITDEDKAEFGVCCPENRLKKALDEAYDNALHKWKLGVLKGGNILVTGITPIF